MTDFIAAQTNLEEILDFLLSAPTPEQVIAFHASESAQERVSYLLEVNRKGTLTDSEREELEEASQLNHVIILLKARARKVLAKS